MGYEEIDQSIKDDIPPIRFFRGVRYIAGMAGYTKSEAKKEIKRSEKCGCPKGDIKRVRDSGGLYTLYHRKSPDRIWWGNDMVYTTQERGVWGMRAIIAVVVVGVPLMLYLIIGIYVDRAFAGDNSFISGMIGEIFGAVFIIIIFAMLLLLMRLDYRSAN